MRTVVALWPDSGIVSMVCRPSGPGLAVVCQWNALGRIGGFAVS
jgi:hypothetical protein